MSLRALAFGPLPKSQVQASQRLSLPSPSSGPSLSGLGSGGGGYDATPTGGGPLREPEAFSPLFPDLFGQEPQGAEDPTAPDFNSETAQTLANPPKGTGVSFPASNTPESWRTDLDMAFKGLKALQGGVRAVEGPQQPVPPPQGPDLDSLARTAGGDTFSIGQPGSQVSGGELGGVEEGIFAPELGGGETGGPALTPGLGSLTSLYGLGTAAASGNPVGIAQGAINSYNAITGLVGQIGSGTVAPISSAIVSAAPEIAAAIAESAGIATAGMSAVELTGALSGALAAWGGAAAPIIQGIVEYINQAEQSRERRAGWRNNPISGALYSNATAGVGQANQLFDSLGTDLTTANTQDLLQALTGGTNSLLPYYMTAQGGAGALTASGAAGSPGTQSKAEYSQNFANAQGKLVNAVNELMRRGATYEELGGLPISGNWAMESLDLDNPLQRLYQGNAAKYDTEGAGLLGGATTRTAPSGTWMQSGEGSVFDPGGGSEATTLPGYGGVQPGTLSPQNLFEAAQGAGAKGPDSATHASSLITSMYGGPLWTAIGRMGAGGPQLQDLIQQHFDPWNQVRGKSPTEFGTALEPVLRRLAMEQQDRGQAFTSGGN